MAFNVHLIPARELHASALQAFLDLGNEPREAALAADHLVEANLTGHDSHGVGMVPRHHDSLIHGGAFLNRQVKVVLDDGSVLALDCNAGWGQVVVAEAMDLSVERARTDLGSHDAGRNMPDDVTLPREPASERLRQHRCDVIHVNATMWKQIHQVAEAAHTNMALA